MSAPALTATGARTGLPGLERALFVVRIALTLTIMTAGALLMLAVAIPTLFRSLRGKGLNLSRAIYPYFLGQVLFAPILAFEKQLNFAMQTVICRRRA